MVEYHTGLEALADPDLMSYLNVGDIAQYGTNEEIVHSMFIYGKVNSCDGYHAGNHTLGCPIAGETDALYAQNVSSDGGNYTQGHIGYLLYTHPQSNIIFIKLNSRFDC